MKNLMIYVTLLVFTSCVPSDYSDLDKSEVSYIDDSRQPGSVVEDSSVSNMQVRMGDRYYIASTFKNVFGPDYDRSNITYNNIIVQQGVFGGNCDLYETNFVGTGRTREDKTTACFKNSKNTKAVLPSTTLREGWRIRACETMINSNANAVKFALAKAGITSSSKIDYQNINKIYQLFFPIDSISTEAANYLISMQDSFDDDDHFWEVTLLITCLDPTWQIP